MYTHSLPYSFDFWFGCRPHVSGLVAYLLGLELDQKITPAEMKKKLPDLAPKGALDPKTIRA